MKTLSRKQLREAINDKGITSVLKVPKSAITRKQRKFVEALVLDEMTGADAYRAAYAANGTPKTVGDAASRLKANCRIQAEIVALEHAKQVAALHTAEALRSLTISTLTSALIDPDVKIATKIQAAKILGQVTEVAAFTERKEITHVQNSGAIKDQIMQQLKTLMLGSADAEIVEVDSLLAEIAGDESGGADTHPGEGGANQEWDSGSHVHTIPLERSEEKTDPSEHPPSPPETHTPGGDIFGENDEVSK